MYEGETIQDHVDRGFVPNYDVIPLLEEDLGINLSEGPQVPEYVKNNYREVVNKVRDGLLEKYGNYLSEDQRDWLDHLEDVTLVLSEVDFDKFDKNRSREEIDSSDLSKVGKSILHIATRLLRNKENKEFDTEATIWNPNNYNPFIFIKWEEGEYSDPQYKKVFVAEEIFHCLSSLTGILSEVDNGMSIESQRTLRKRRNTIITIDEHAAKRYAYTFIEGGEDFLSSHFNFWREMGMKYGEEEMARIYFQGQSDVVSMQKLLEEARAYHLFYPPY